MRGTELEEQALQIGPDLADRPNGEAAPQPWGATMTSGPPQDAVEVREVEEPETLGAVEHGLESRVAETGAEVETGARH